MNKLIEVIFTLLVLISWLVGIVIAKGFWSCLFATIIPPYAWYLVIEKLMLVNGWL